MRNKSDTAQVTCYGCSDQIEPGTLVCSCGLPTPFMSFDERRAYEAQAWRAYRQPAVTA